MGDEAKLRCGAFMCTLPGGGQGQSCTTLVQVQGHDVPVLVYDSQLPIHEA